MPTPALQQPASISHSSEDVAHQVDQNGAHIAERILGENRTDAWTNKTQSQSTSTKED